MKKPLLIVPIFLVLALISNTSLSDDTNHRFILMSGLEWQPLNPARGDKSPMAATLWGDRNGIMATGFLVKFVDGFSSPPHIHNVSYRGLVIDGHIHNDDPNAEKMWMPSGSFWTQPAGEIHITAAKGEYNLAYIEIDKGPYLVHPTDDAFDNGERPVNMVKSNIVWVQQGMSSSSDGIALAYLWGTPDNGQSYGVLAKIPAGFTMDIHSNGTIFHAVVVEGQINYQPGEAARHNMTPGSYFSDNKDSPASIHAKQESIVYVRTNGTLDFLQK